MAQDSTSVGYPSHWEADVVLRDGAAAHLRPIGAEDAERLQRMHAAQSQSSIYLRYFTYKSALTSKELAHFTGVDHVDRVALVILLDERIIGVGRYDRIEDTAEAEVSFNIADEHQGRGLGSILLEHLAAAGRERGIERFTAEVLPENRKMLMVFTEAGYEVERRFEDGVVALTFPIDPTDRSRAVMESREHRAEARSVAELTAPAHVAVVGASRQPGTAGHQVLHNIVEGRFTGGVHAINSEAFEVGGTTAHGSLGELKQTIDLAVLCVPAEQLPDVVADCGRHGVRGLVVITDGLEAVPSGDDEGLGAADDAGEPAPSSEAGIGFDQRALVRLARRWGMRVIGPASVGLIRTDPDVSLNASLSPQMPLRGGVGLFSQSAPMGISLHATAHRRGVGVSTVISAGSRADLSGNDAMQHFEDDPATRAVGLSLESLGNPRKFSRIARRLSLSKPVVVATSGVMGRSLPPGHDVRTTRAPGGAVESMLEQSGVIPVGNHDSLMDVLQVLASQPLPVDGRLGVLADSPAMAAALADAAERHGLHAVRTDGGLRLDGTRRQAQETIAAALQAMLDAEVVDAVAVCLQPGLDGVHRDLTEAISAAARQHPKPVVLSLIGVLDPQAPLNLLADAAPVIETGALQQGLPIFSSPERSVAALGKIVDYQRWRRRGIGDAWIPRGLEGLEGTAVRRSVDELLDGWLAEAGGGPRLHRLDPARTAELLGRYGLEVMESVPFSTEDEAVAAAERLGYPVAVKATTDSLRHRLDLGGVRLSIADATMLRRTVAEMREQLAGYGAPGLEVQAMAPTGQGCMVSALEDPLMGPVVSFGVSGDAVELLDDWAHAVPPLTDQDVADLVRRPRAARRLLGHRGLPAVDLDAVEDAVQRVAILKDEHPQVASLQLSPLLAGQDGVRILHASVDIADPQQRTDSARRAISRW